MLIRSLTLAAVLSLPLACSAGATAGTEPATPKTVQESDDNALAAAEAEHQGPTPPDFELSTLDGQPFRLSEHLGRHVILIDFWATFCGPCLAAMPHLEALYKEHEDDGLLIVGISLDGPDSIAQVRAEVRKHQLTFPILLDQETSVVALYNPKTSAPFSVLIGKDGRIITKKEGYTTGGGAQLERDLLTALGK